MDEFEVPDVVEDVEEVKPSPAVVDVGSETEDVVVTGGLEPSDEHAPRHTGTSTRATTRAERRARLAVARPRRFAR